ncbi:ABC transporter permease [Bacillus pumilus]|uniref:ABC transporter permease n=1 Tax=Bacillus pumilus TaxID=1408 RepID=UPI002113827D|nr:ABC transporter permease subunit [Bacillus pumilus]UUD42651.1 ABC transporter permease subunit [Bacillus pumilus]
MNSIIKAEFYKQYKSKYNFFFLIFIILCIAVSGVELFIHSSSDWKKDLKENIDSDERLLSTIDNKDSIYYFEIDKKVKLNNYALKNNIPPFEEHNFLGFIMKNINMCLMIGAYSVYFSSNSISKEYQLGTFEFLFIRPYNKKKILIGKFMFILIYTLFLFCFLFLFSTLIGLVIHGFDFNNLKFTDFENDKIIEKNGLTVVTYTYIMYYLSSISYASLAFMLSNIFKTGGIPFSITMLSMLFGQNLIHSLPVWIYELSLFSNASSLTRSTTLGESVNSIVILILYIIVFLLISIYFFEKNKDSIKN